jgi:hypothetical protein
VYETTINNKSKQDLMNYSSDTAGNDLLIQFIVFNKVAGFEASGERVSTVPAANSCYNL